MEADPFASPQWWRACTLAERGAASAGRAAAGDGGERARLRFERWRGQLPFTTETYFSQRLALAGLDEEQLLALLDEPVEHVQRRQPQRPPWLEQLRAAFTPATPAEGDMLAEGDFAEPDEGMAEDEPLPDADVFALLTVVQPVIDDACIRLLQELSPLVESGAALPFDPATIEDVLLMNLPDPLFMRLSRALVLELNVARLQDLLEGETPEARFNSFIDRLWQPEVAIAILQEYPVLARQLVLCINQWAAVSLEFVRRLCADWDAIRACFCPDDDPGVLIELSGGAGDTHRGGHSVMIAEFSSGFRLVYKPKSLAIDIHFQDLLAWLNQRGCEPPLYTLAMLDRGEYGWVEFVARTGCTTADEIARFYARHGAYLALLYALNANDFHFENVIAAGEHPVLIDLETLLQPQFERYDTARGELAAERILAESVLQIGLLPARTWSGEDFVGVDISGLGGPTGQLSPDRLPQLVATGTDAMRYTRERIPLTGEAHRPSLNGADVAAADYVNEIVAGFARTYRLLAAHRNELAASDGPLQRFARDEIRVLLRQTRTYDQLLFESFHPDMLHDALERERFLDRLWIAATGRPYLARVVHAEQIDLQNGDIPIFVTYPSTLDLYSAPGERIEGVLQETGMAAVERRLRELSEADLTRQEWFIRTAFATVETARPRPPREETDRPAAAASRAQLVSGARAVFDRLAATAIDGVDDVSWLGLEQLDATNWDIRPVGIELADGIAGITLSLAYAGTILKQERYTMLARRGLNTLSWQSDLLREEMLQLGAHDGWGGVLYALTHLAALWDDETVRARADGLVDRLPGLVAQDDLFDVGRGASGALIALLGHYRCFGSAEALAAARVCGDHVLAAATPTEHGVTWPLIPPTTGPRAGLRHGAIGITWALLELAVATGDEQYHRTAAQALAHVAAEAHATPVIDAATAVDSALAQLCLLRHVNGPWLCDALQSSMTSAVTGDAPRADALGDGLLGLLELTEPAAPYLDTSVLTSQRGSWPAVILAGRERGNWRCGGPPGIEIPGLLQGLAGIGYGLLRLAAPERVPSVLMLAPPLRRDRL